jgi:thiamine biosynthesis lipoprotein
MGTLVRIQLYADSEQRAADAFRAAFARIAQLDEALSDYKPDSELNRLSRAAAGVPVKVSADLFQVLAASQKLAEETGGAFDVTLGPVIRLWRQARKEHRLPDAEALREAGEHCSYQKLHLDPAKRTVSLGRAGMQLDLGGIAKGYAADAALLELSQLGIRQALVAVSGDLAIGDPPPGRRGWKIGVQDRIVELSNAAVSTSGDAEQHLDANGTRYSHIIDPSTGMGITSQMAVTIVARRGIDADGLATAASVLGVERGLAFIESRPDAKALFTLGARTVESSLWTGH